MQYLDDVEDIFYAAALLTERLRRFLKTTLLLSVSVFFQILGVLLALGRPPIAFAIACLVTVAMLYRSVTGPHPVEAP